MDSVLSEYQASLAELTFNSKPHINMLTVLAEENVHYASDIVKIIEKQLNQVKLFKINDTIGANILYLIKQGVKKVLNNVSKALLYT